MATLSGTAAYRLGELTPPAEKAAKAAQTASRTQTRHLRASDSIEAETREPLTDEDALTMDKSASISSVETETKFEPVSAAPLRHEAAMSKSAEELQLASPRERHMETVFSRPSQTLESSEAGADKTTKPDAVAQPPIPSTPKRRERKKALLDDPPMTPRIKKKIPWKGKNIMILVPRDDNRGKPGQAPAPLRPYEIERMFASWAELGYNVAGFDLIIANHQSAYTNDAQSRECWPSADDLINERATGHFQVTLPDLNAWKDYVQELQEAKLRALGVSDATEEPPTPSISPSLTIPSRQSSAQYPPLPFSPPIPTSSASSNPAFNLQSQLRSGTTTSTQSPGFASPVPFGQVQGKFKPRQSISLPTGNSQFQLSNVQGWQNQAGVLQNLTRTESPLLSLNGIVSPQTSYDMDGYPISSSPALNAHQRHQSLQYFPQQMARASPHLPQLREDDEEDAESYQKSPSKTPEPTKSQKMSLQANMHDAQYHLEEQLRNQFEHEDYHPHSRANSVTNHEAFTSAHNREASGNFAVSKHFANDQPKPVVLHHPRPHSRGQSVTPNFFRDHDTQSDGTNFDRLNGIPESGKTEGEEDHEEIETNPSNLGTPVQNFDFPAVLSHHQKTLSTASNPWKTVAKIDQTSDHERKTSTSKLNVKAPEFKFNPTSSFTPGLFNFSPAPSFEPIASSFQPSVFQTGFNHYSESGASVAQSDDNSLGLIAEPPSFAPGQSEFSFSTSGPKFRPDAPSFTPFKSLANSLNTVGKNHQGRTDSIFGNINIDAHQGLGPVRKSKAIPIIRPSSKSSTRSVLIDTSEKSDEPSLDNDGRLTQDESRIKRARSLAPEGQEVASFAQMPPSSTLQPGDGGLYIDLKSLSVHGGDTSDTNQTVNLSEFSPAAEDEERQPLQAANEDAILNSHDVQKSAQLDNKRKAHKRNSLSATAIPFSPGATSYGDALLTIPAKPKGLAASRFAKADHTAPQSQPEDNAAQNAPMSVRPSIEAKETVADHSEDSARASEPTFEEIDAVMQQMEHDPNMGVNKSLEQSTWIQSAAVANQLPLCKLSAVAHEFVPQFKQAVPAYPTQSEHFNASMTSIELEDPFIDPPSRDVETANAHDLEPETEPVSDWEATFTEDEHAKLESRAQFFDGRVNEVVGNLLASRLEPMERALLEIQNVVDIKSRRAPSSRRDRRSTTGENQESDADDEDDEAIVTRSLSPRRDRRLDQMRAMITAALASQHVNPVPTASDESSSILAALEEMKGHLSELKHSSRLERSGDDEKSGEFGPSASKSDDAILAKLDQLQIKNVDLEQHLQYEQSKLEKEVEERRAVEDAFAELKRKLHAAETRVEVEIINKSVYDQRVGDLEERLRLQEERSEEELKQRRLLEDKLCDAQRQLKHASEEESRLTEALDDRDRRIKDLEQVGGKKAMRMTLLEAASNNASQTQSEMANKLNALEGDLREVRQDNNHWRAEAERADETARHNAGELAVAREESQTLQNTLQTVTIHLQENERLRESWRGKFMSLQEDMATAAREIAEESAKRIQRDQSMLARQEVLDARLQAEAKTRERLEIEMERLQMNERSGMRAVKECARLECVIEELRTDKDKLQQTASRYQREFEEARESGASEVKRTRMSLQTEIDAANHQVNVVRQELEEQNAKLRGKIDSVRMEVDLAKERSEMLLEEEQTNKAKALHELERKHQNEIEDMQVRYERQINNAAEDNQRSEEALLERLSLSVSKIEHLNDRVLHLEGQLDISKQAAAAAAQAAKAAGVERASFSAHVPTRSVSTELPEKISPQALRESIMVLQEQLQAREQRIEELEQQISKLDPEAASKISKRDEEINWLRELLAVRHSDLQDIIAALSVDSFDHERVKDAAIRLEANLQMEEQERERTMNGGSAMTMPNIAQSIQAATPRVAQTIGSGLNALDRWRKSGQSSFFSGVLSSPVAGPAATPSRSKPSSAQQSKLLSGLLTPPASGFRQTPVADSKGSTTAFTSTGRRFSARSQPRRRSGSSAIAEAASESEETTPPRRQKLPEDPVTPPMMRQNGYDSDAQPGDFDDHDFFED